VFGRDAALCEVTLANRLHFLVLVYNGGCRTGKTSGRNSSVLVPHLPPGWVVQKRMNRSRYTSGAVLRKLEKSHVKAVPDPCTEGTVLWWFCL